MLVSTLLTAAVVLSHGVSSVVAHPGMANVVSEIKERAAAAADTDDLDSNELIGDLCTLPDKSLTSVGKDIKDLLLGDGRPQGWDTYSNVPALGTQACAKDTCCVWKYIADDMAAAFRGSGGRCNRYARMGIRMGFHDAGGWSKQTASQPGGADGSLLLAGEITLAENKGLEDMGVQMQAWYDKWHTKNGYTSVTMADLIQMSATVATVVCPLGPRIRSFVGRKDCSTKNPALLPSASASADSLIQLFKDKTIKPNGLVALLGAHTTSQQRDFDTSRANDPQDSSPGVWDVLFYIQTLNPLKAPKRVYMLPSDLAIAKHPTTSPEWNEFAVNQTYWDEEYAREYIRLSLLGVNNINTLTECTKVLPNAVTTWNAPDQSNMDKWLSTNTHNTQSDQIAASLQTGASIAGFTINIVNGVLTSVTSVVSSIFGSIGGLFGLSTKKTY